MATLKWVFTMKLWKCIKESFSNEQQLGTRVKLALALQKNCQTYQRAIEELKKDPLETRITCMHIITWKNFNARCEK